MAPDFSPWGIIDWIETLAPGFEMVATPSHGGIMVSRDASFMLSPAARKCGSWNGGYLCFEEDAAENVVLRELLDAPRIKAQLQQCEQAEKEAQAKSKSKQRKPKGGYDLWQM